MAWKIPQESDLAAYMAQDEIDAFRSMMGFDPSNGRLKDPVAQVLEDTATMVRGYCHVQLDRSSVFSIPQSLMSSAMCVARYRILTRMSLDVNEARRVDYEKAMEHMSLVAKGDVLVEPPDGMEDDGARVVPLWGFSFKPKILR